MTQEYLPIELTEIIANDSFYHELVEVGEFLSKECQEIGVMPSIGGDLRKKIKAKALNSALENLDAADLKKLFSPNGKINENDQSDKKTGKRISNLIDNEKDSAKQEKYYAAAYWAEVKNMTRICSRQWGQTLPFASINRRCPACRENVVLKFGRDNGKTRSKQCPKCGHYFESIKTCTCKKCMTRSEARKEFVLMFIEYLKFKIKSYDLNNIMAIQQNLVGRIAKHTKGDLFASYQINRSALSPWLQKFVKIANEYPREKHESEESVLHKVYEIATPTNITDEYTGRDLWRELFDQVVVTHVDTFTPLTEDEIRTQLTNRACDSLVVIICSGKSFGGQRGRKLVKLARDTSTRFSSISFDKQNTIPILMNKTTEYIFNPYFIKIKNEVGNNIIRSGVSSIFDSPAHKLDFDRIQKRHDGAFVAPNYQITKFVNLDYIKIQMSFSVTELKHLKKASVYLLVFDDMGEPLVVYKKSFHQENIQKEELELLKLKERLFNFCGLNHIEI